MRFGNLEIRWRTVRRLASDEIDRTGAFAVADTTAWWLAVHKVLNEVEAEVVEGARNRIKDTNACIAAVGAGEGVALVRQRLIETREYALSQIKKPGEPMSAWD